MAKKPKLGKLISSEPLNESFDDIKEEARVLIFDKGQRPHTFIHNDEIVYDMETNEMLQGKFILYRETEDSDLKMSYECDCGNSESATAEFEGPYTINCSECEKLVYLRQKAKGKGVPRKG